MTRLRLLDLFGGAGGAAMGYQRAGFDVTCCDLISHDDNPFPLVIGDAMTMLAAPAVLDAFDVVHASPPCPRYSTVTPKHRREQHPDLVAPVRELLTSWATRTGGLWIIENVPGAPLMNPVRLCGSSFGLRVRRHRLFESNAPLWALPCQHASQGTPVGVYGQHGDAAGAVPRPSGTSRGVKASCVADAQNALGIDWMASWDDLADSVPPAYTKFIGEQMLDHLAKSEAA